MKLEIFRENRKVGVLNISREGLYSVYEAETEKFPGLMRLYTEGEDEFFSPGLMKPEKDRLSFRRKFTAMQLSAFPRNPERALILPADEKPQEKKQKTVQKPENYSIIKKQSKTEKIWTELPDGCLFGLAGGHSFLAFPCDIHEKIRGIRRVMYKNREYIVFRY